MEEKIDKGKDPAGGKKQPSTAGQKRVVSTSAGLVDLYRTDRQPVKVAIIFAILFHIIVLWVVVPEMGGRTTEDQADDAVVIKRFKPPDPPEQQQTRKKRVARSVPIPDPTPDDPEPVQEPLDPDEFYEDYQANVGWDIELPNEAPPTGPLRVGGNVKAPEVLKKVEPTYNDIAKNAGIEGVVILEAVIGTDGRAHDIKVLRSLRFLDEEAVKAVQQWEFKPATLNEEPVEVFFVLTVTFQLRR